MEDVPASHIVCPVRRPMYFVRDGSIRFQRMTKPRPDYIRPLCPIHYEVMVISPLVSEPLAVAATEGTAEIHDCECLVDGCPQHYSPSYGYFTVARNDDHWAATGSSSLRIRRGPIQAICGEHRDSMFLESFDCETQVQNFRCPQEACHQTMKIVAGGPPTYWLGEGFFEEP
jgi:hypothetical protein